jgi:hypothetical protein
LFFALIFKQLNKTMSDTTKEITPLVEIPKFEASFEAARDYMQNKVTGSLLVGGMGGLTTGFYLGESAAL